MAVSIRKIADADADKCTFKGFGISGTADAGTSSNIDYKLTEERLVYGGQAILKNHAFGDSIKFQVIDIDNILGLGVGTVLGEYMAGWLIADDTQVQPVVMVDFPTKISPNIYFRIVYTSVGATNVSVGVNIFCLKVIG